ncbi:MAG: ABC transporter substrate-binding protein, partial [Burkholderiales bacterium]|nr:ABC transporter substrate-binding protein [Burkholderiales bacterium]
YEPFRKETGIEVVPVPSSAGKLVAMFKAGRPDLDVIETGPDILWLLEDAGALAPIPYHEFKFTDPADLEPFGKTKFHVAMTVYADVLGYNTKAVSADKVPRNWAEFWDGKAFPGRRGLADMQSGVANLEFALLADGVAPDKIYPIDIPRAFKSLSRVKPYVVKFWDSGALSAQMLTDGETVLSAIWSSRAQAARDKGAPVAIAWNQNLVNLTSTSIVKDTRNMNAAKMFVDYTLSPKVQERWLGANRELPINRKAYGSIAPELIDPASGKPWTTSRGIVKDARWWADNRQRVSEAWSKWVIS